MKRSLRIACALFLILGLCSVLVAVSAAADPESLQISKIAVTQDGDNTALHMTLNNTGSAAIDEFGVALAFYDENGDRIFGYDATLEGYTGEVCNWYYAPEEAIAAGDDYKTEDIFAEYAGTADIGAAIRYYHIADGDYIMLPESEWQWTFPGFEAESGALQRVYYVSPPDSLYDTISSFYLGYSYYLLDDYNAFYYGKNQGGEWITQVEPDSAAANAGLEVGDLVMFVDGVKPTENMYAVEYAMEAVVGGDAIDWVYERGGIIYTTRISNP
ncbi:MAG: PDZ domain-containing protein [Bacillota bacterium]